MGRQIATAIARSTASGVLGWIALMAAFEGAYRVECWVRRK